MAKNGLAPASTLERAITAAGIVKAGGAAHLGGARFRVQSSNRETWYIADLQTQTCTCPDNRYRGVLCKHLHAARQAAEPARIRVRLATDGTIAGWRYVTAEEDAKRHQATEREERQERIARLKQIADELFPF